MKATAIQCDVCKVQGPTYLEPETVPTDEMRRRAAAHGWIIYAGKDICPNCPIFT